MKIDQIRILLSQISKEYQFLEDSLIENSRVVEKLSKRIKEANDYLDNQKVDNYLQAKKDLKKILGGNKWEGK